jgi:hypothetical protein
MNIFQETSVALPIPCEAAYAFEKRIAGLCEGNIVIWELKEP